MREFHAFRTFHENGDKGTPSHYKSIGDTVLFVLHKFVEKYLA